jgi:hypothetical protein
MVIFEECKTNMAAARNLYVAFGLTAKTNEPSVIGKGNLVQR